MSITISTSLQIQYNMRCTQGSVVYPPNVLDINREINQAAGCDISAPCATGSPFRLIRTAPNSSSIIEPKPRRRPRPLLCVHIGGCQRTSYVCICSRKTHWGNILEGNTDRKSKSISVQSFFSAYDLRITLCKKMVERV